MTGAVGVGCWRGDRAVVERAVSVGFWRCDRAVVEMAVGIGCWRCDRVSRCEVLAAWQGQQV